MLSAYIIFWSLSMSFLRGSKKLFGFISASPKSQGKKCQSCHSEDIQRIEELRHFDASFACSGLVDIEGIRNAIFQWKHDENEKSNEVLPKAAAKQSQLDKS
jgi:hypothetical protein